MNRHFGRYRLIEPLGESGPTRAYRAKSIGVEGFEKQVVVWRIARDPASEVRSHETLIGQAKRAAFLSHANIAQVLDVGLDDGDCFVTTEYVAGVSLAAVLARQSLHWPTLVHIAVQVANALDYAHRRRDANQDLLGIVHRSVSPHRILLSTAGGVKLTGFGTTWTHTREPPVYGARYRSREQLGGEPVDGRSDVYALARLIRDSLLSDHPIEIAHALSRALENYPENRSTAGELRDDLSKALHERGEWVSPQEVASLATDSVSASVSARASVSASARERARGLVATASQLEAYGAFYAAIDHLEAALEDVNLDSPGDIEAALALYERLGKLCVRAHVGDRGASAMIAGLDLADGMGRDDYVAGLCGLLAELLTQAERLDEGQEWRDRAHQVAVRANRSRRGTG